MGNPWPQLPTLTTEAPYVLQRDLSIIEKFNARNADKHDRKCPTPSTCAGCFIVQTRLLPEPFIGDPDGRVCLLNLNPGYRKEDERWHTHADFRAAIIDNLSHRTAEFPFYYFDPRLEKAPGSEWWRKCASRLINHIGLKKLAHNLFCVELFPYHSKKYRSVPKTVVKGCLKCLELSPDKLVPSSAYGIHLVRRAIRTNRTIIVMRSCRTWCAHIPQLRGYRNLFHLRNTRRPWLSPGNIEEYDRLVRELDAIP